jgi:hypothetical protein
MEYQNFTAIISCVKSIFVNQFISFRTFIINPNRINMSLVSHIGFLVTKYNL